MNAAVKYFSQATGLALALISLLTIPGLAAERTGRVLVPENGYATGASYGTGWKCSFGYVEERGACVAVAVPENGFLSERGDRWQCERGYRLDGDECLMIEVPANAYLKPANSKGWQCERGYRDTGNVCEAIRVPANAYLTNSSFGDSWKCDRGYRATNTDCVKIDVPDNAFLVDLNYGPGWQCGRGYVVSNSDTCRKILVPSNAHLTRAGDEWKCNPPYLKLGKECVLR